MDTPSQMRNQLNSMMVDLELRKFGLIFFDKISEVSFIFSIGYVFSN